MQDWLPIVAALVGALATFGVWAYVSRQRLHVRAAELERTLEARTTELESARIQLQRLSTEDPLTAVANHEQFLEFLEREWRRARRDGLPLTLIFIDIDHFRAYNREFGRKAGDEVLKQVGRALAGIVGRPGDLVARYHRDEFALVLASTDGPGAFNISEQVRRVHRGLEDAGRQGRTVRLRHRIGGDRHRRSAAGIGLGRARSDQGGAARAARSPRNRRESRPARQPWHGGAARARDTITSADACAFRSRCCTIRPWAETDADSLQRHANNRHVSMHLRDRFPFPYEIEQARTFLGWIAEAAVADGVGDRGGRGSRRRHRHRAAHRRRARLGRDRLLARRSRCGDAASRPRR